MLLPNLIYWQNLYDIQTQIQTGCRQTLHLQNRIHSGQAQRTTKLPATHVQLQGETLNITHTQCTEMSSVQRQ